MSSLKINKGIPIPISTHRLVNKLKLKNPSQNVLGRERCKQSWESSPEEPARANIKNKMIIPVRCFTCGKVFSSSFLSLSLPFFFFLISPPRIQQENTDMYTSFPLWISILVDVRRQR